MQRGRSLVFDDEEIEDLADMQYGNRLTFALLSLLFPFIDLQNSHFHVDHVFPAAHFTRRQLMDSGVSEGNIDGIIGKRNGLANLQLLQGNLNLEKSAKSPSEWLDGIYPNDPSGRQAYQDRHLLGDVPKSIEEFDTFFEARRERLKRRITQLLGRSPSSGETKE